MQLLLPCPGAKGMTHVQPTGGVQHLVMLTVASALRMVRAIPKRLGRNTMIKDILKTIPERICNCQQPTNRINQPHQPAHSPV